MSLFPDQSENSNLDQQISAVLVGDPIPKDWILRSQTLDLRTVYQVPEGYVTLFDLDQKPLRLVSGYSYIKTRADLSRETQFEYAAQVEHLQQLGRIGDANSIRFIAGEGTRSVIISPNLGRAAESILREWQRNGLPKNDMPLSADQYNRLFECLLVATHINGDAGLYNLVIDPKKGPCFIDITSANGEHEDFGLMTANYKMLGQELGIAFKEIHPRLQEGEDEAVWNSVIANYRCLAIPDSIDNMLERKTKQPLYNLGLKSILSDSEQIFFILASEVEFYLVVYGDEASMVFNQNTQNSIIGKPNTFIQEVNGISLHFNRSLTQPDLTVLQSSWGIFLKELQF